MDEQLALQKILRERLHSYQFKNPAFSIRAFSKKIGVTPGTLSLFLLGKRRISKKTATLMADRLMLDPQERSNLLNGFPAPVRSASTEASAKANDEEAYLQISADQFHVVADWYYFAILNLIVLEETVHTTSYLAARLGLSEKTVDQAIERLLRVGLIEKSGSRFKRMKSRYRTSDDVQNISLRKSHHQTLELAKDSLESRPLEERDVSYVTFPFDPAKLPQAKILIRKFQDDLLDLLEVDAKPTEVYRLAVQLFPLTQKKGKS